MILGGALGRGSASAASSPPRPPATGGSTDPIAIFCVAASCSGNKPPGSGLLDRSVFLRSL